MEQPLKVLIVEDSENDAALLEIELERAGYAPFCERVQTADELGLALGRQRWDVIIADYVLPHFNGLAALAIVKEKGLDLPFIIVSGHITDATAVAAISSPFSSTTPRARPLRTTIWRTGVLRRIAAP